MLSSRDGKPSLPKLAIAAFIGEMAYYACGLIYYFIMFNFVISGTEGIGIAQLFSVWFLSTVIPDTVILHACSGFGLQTCTYYAQDAKLVMG